MRRSKNIYDCKRMTRLFDYVKSFDIKLTELANRMCHFENKIQFNRHNRYQVFFQQLRDGKIASTSAGNLNFLARALEDGDNATYDDILDNIYEILRLIPLEFNKSYRRVGLRFINNEFIRFSSNVDFAIDICEAFSAFPDDKLIEKISELIKNWINGEILNKYLYFDLLAHIADDLEKIGLPPQYDSVDDELAYRIITVDHLLIIPIIKDSHMLLLNGVVNERVLEPFRSMRSKLEEADSKYLVEYVTKTEKKYPVLRGKI